jgi:hypothetical protein
MKKGRITMGVAAVLLLGGCSSFNREWSAALKQPVPASDLSGPWEGHWTSDVNGHNDKLRCLITQKSPDQYNATFHATYKSIFHFSYTVPLQVRKHANSFVFSGEADLGKMAGGVYTYEGATTATNFFSTYDSKYDHGKFDMHRPTSDK